MSFQFGDNDHIAFSIEARYKAGQSYSAILGFFRQYELIFITADERDVIRLRTNYRKGEEVRLYRTTVSPATARRIFLSYVDYLNQLRDHPSGTTHSRRIAQRRSTGRLLRRSLIPRRGAISSS